MNKKERGKYPPECRVPGKLLTGKGPVPGVLGSYGDVWGKLKVTGDDAEELMGFRPKEGAIGVVLRRCKYTDKKGKVRKGIFASSLMPGRHIPNTKKSQMCFDRMSVIRMIGSEHLKDLIHPIWNPLSVRGYKKFYSGFNYFMSVNLKAVGLSLDLSKLLISDGEIEPPKEVCQSWYTPDSNEIKIVVPSTNFRTLIPNYEIGIGIVDKITGSSYHIAPMSRDTLEHRVRIWKLKQVRRYYNPCGPKLQKRFYIYMYYKKGEQFSKSICSRINVQKKRKNKDNMLTIKVVDSPNS